MSAYPVAECDREAMARDGFKCHNGGSCVQIELNETTRVRICQCSARFTGRQCEQPLSSSGLQAACSPDLCQPNGYCNALSGGSSEYTCRCKPGYQGVHCETNINDCLNATCYNGGLCIDGVNSYECECPWPYYGRYCQTRMTCHSMPDLCKNNGICVDDTTDNKNDNAGPVCICQSGFSGRDCSSETDICSGRGASLCLHDSECVSSLDGGYECRCKPGYTGKNCQLVDMCVKRNPCRNDALCVSLLNPDSTDTIYPQYSCQCTAGFTGTHCETKLAASCQGKIKKNINISKISTNNY